jgi:hypothetical protein
LQAIEQIQGSNGEHLPWEGKGMTAAKLKQLGVFRTDILKLLDRDPSKRPSMAQFCDTCARLVAAASSL